MEKKKLLMILLLNFMCLFTNCRCPPERYFDYKKLEVTADKIFIPLNDRLMLRISTTEIEYLVKSTTYVGFGVSAYATSVCEPGYDGEKYPITHVYISSNSDFDNNHIAGTELNNLIKIYGTNSEGEYVLGYLKDFEISKINPGYIYIESRPKIDKKHIFTIKFEKSNGEIVSGVSEEVTWE